jgi:hypothetical protein
MATSPPLDCATLVGPGSPGRMQRPCWQVASTSMLLQSFPHWPQFASSLESSDGASVHAHSADTQLGAPAGQSASASQLRGTPGAGAHSARPSPHSASPWPTDSSPASGMATSLSSSAQPMRAAAMHIPPTRSQRAATVCPHMHRLEHRRSLESSAAHASVLLASSPLVARCSCTRRLRFSHLFHRLLHRLAASHHQLGVGRDDSLPLRSPARDRSG